MLRKFLKDEKDFYIEIISKKENLGEAGHFLKDEIKLWNFLFSKRKVHPVACLRITNFIK